MLTLGLTGGSGTGKGYVAKLLSKAGIPTIDTDAVYHDMCHRSTPCMQALAEFFGEEIFSDDGQLDRKKLGGIVFSSPEKLDFLNRTTHKFILDETRRRLKEYFESGAFAVTVDAPVLFESGFDCECDYTVAVLATDDERVRRIVKRDGISEEAAKVRITKQKSNEFFIENCDYILYNNDSDMIERQCACLVSELVRKSEQRK